MIVQVIPGELRLPPSRTARGEGIHVSSIIRCIATETGILKPEWCEELDLLELLPSTRERFNDPTVALKICMGLAWEEWYVPHLPEVVDHPGEMEVDGVYMNHDGEELTLFLIDEREQYHPVVVEVKTTYKSINTVGRDVNAMKTQWMWMAQVKSYCKGVGTRFARVHVLFICGDYSYPIQPVLLIYEIEFTQEEIDDNWDLMVNYKDRRLEIERRD